MSRKIPQTETTVAVLDGLKDTKTQLYWSVLVLTEESEILAVLFIHAFCFFFKLYKLVSGCVCAHMNVRCLFW